MNVHIVFNLWEVVLFLVFVLKILIPE